MMNQNDETDATLPSVADALPGYGASSVVVLTIVFHPQLSRIGQSAVLPARALGGKSPLVLGRQSLSFAHESLFAQPGNATRQSSLPPPLPLQDRYISRCALVFESLGPRGAQGLRLRREEDASRCRVDGEELARELELSAAQLQAGVAIYLAHTVVLMLRSQSARGAVHSQPTTLLGSSGYMHALRRQIVQAAGSDLDVLIRGETGTGKELVAAAVRALSPRHKAPLISVNMAAIPAALAAASLFGAARGAYTGAERATEGYFQQAQGGTLFLDEIGEAPLELQPQLLRALQQREVQPVGGPVQRVDVRIISATDADLDGAECDFKSALRHRLGAVEIVLQPLRHHPEDIGELLLHFLQQSLESIGRSDLLPQEDSEQILIAASAGLFYRLLRYSWPGNVRQLANVAAQVALASEDQLTLPSSLYEEMEAETFAAVDEQSCSHTASDQVRRSMHAVDEQIFHEAMLCHGHEVRAVADSLGVSYQAVYRRIQASPQYRLAADIPDEELQQVMQSCDGDISHAALLLCVSQVSLKTRIRSLQQRT